MSFTALNILNDSETYKINNEEREAYKLTDSFKNERIQEVTKSILEHYEFNQTHECIVFNISDVGDSVNELIGIIEGKGFKCVIDDQDILTINI